VLKDMTAAYDHWWIDVLPRLENEDAYRSAPAENPFKTLFRMQFGEERIRRTSGARS
jgi:hypothetical protein